MNTQTKLLTIVGIAGVLLLAACQSDAPPAEMKEITTQTSGDLKITLVSGSGELKQGQNQFQMMFRSVETGEPVDVGMVTVSSSMSMPGMAPMVAPMEMTHGGTGNYMMHGTFGMSGAWRFDVQWDGPAGKGNTSFNSSVR
jgi:hypothetical protein